MPRKERGVSVLKSLALSRSRLENRPRAHRGAPARVVVMVVVVMRLRSLRGMQEWRGGLQVGRRARSLVIPRVVSQKSRGGAARAGARAARAAASAARAAAARHPLRRAEVPGCWRRDRRGGTWWGSAGSRVLLCRDLAAFPHLLELGSAVLEPDFDLCRQKKETSLSF